MKKILDIYPFNWTKWKCVTVQKHFPTGHLNSFPFIIPSHKETVWISYKYNK